MRDMSRGRPGLRARSHSRPRPRPRPRPLASRFSRSACPPRVRPHGARRVDSRYMNPRAGRHSGVVRRDGPAAQARSPRRGGHFERPPRMVPLLDRAASTIRTRLAAAPACRTADTDRPAPVPRRGGHHDAAGCRRRSPLPRVCHRQAIMRPARRPAPPRAASHVRLSRSARSRSGHRCKRRRQRR